MINTAYFLSILFIFVRLSSFFIVFKVIFPSGTPRHIKLFLPMVMAYTIVGGIDLVDIDLISSNYYLAMYLVSEASTGAILGLITSMVFESIKFAGSWIDLHIGFSMTSLINPSSASSSTPNGTLLEYVAMTLFFISDTHHLVIKSLIESVNLVPIGKNILSGETMMICVDIIAQYFLIGIKIALPIVIIILLTDLSMGLISRVVPQINVMILGMPIKMMVGLLMIIMSLPLIIKVILSTFSYLPSMLKKVLTVVPVALVFASDDKTEEATPKKKSDAKKKGQIARSKDISIAVSLLVIILLIYTLSGSMVESIIEVMIYYLGNVGGLELTDNALIAVTTNAISKFLTIVLPFIISIMIAGVASNIMQTGFMFTGEGLKPSLKKLNPINGIKNMFTMRKAFDLLKNLLVVVAVGFLGFTYMKNNYEEILQIAYIQITEVGIEIKSIVAGLLTRIAIFSVVLAAIDYFVQFKFHKKDLKMTKQEIKDEYKQAEGDQQVKAKIRQKQRAMSRQRMIQAVGDATVVITNPTHIAVAIKYEDGKNSAPRLVAKGSENLAIKIKDVAKENNVPIVENKPLARMIYKEVEVEQEIPQKMYQAVAEILVVIFKMNKKKR